MGGLFVSVKEEPKVEEPAPVEEAPEAEPEEDADAKEEEEEKKKAAKQISSFLYFYAKTLVALEKASNFENSTFQIRNGRYEGGDRPSSNNIVSWYLTLTDISFIKNSQFTNKDILLWAKKKKKKKKNFFGGKKKKKKKKKKS